MPFLLYAQHKKLVVGKKSGLVELSRASRFSRSLARLASGKFQLVSSPANYCWRNMQLCNFLLKRMSAKETEPKAFLKYIQEPFKCYVTQWGWEGV